MQQCYDISNISRKLKHIISHSDDAETIKANKIALSRKDLIQKFALLQKKNLSLNECLEILSISKSTLYRWKAQYKKGFQKLKPQSKTPHSFRKKKYSKELSLAVYRMRKKHPLWGKGKIQKLLERDKIKTSISTVGRIISLLIKRKSILSAVVLRGYNSPKRRRRFKKHAVRLPKGMRSHSVGELIQIDHMTVELHGKKVKHFNAWDRKSKWNVAEVYSRATAYCASKFLDQVIKKSPFKIKSIQVDGGSEFMKEFEDACEKNGIKLYVLPPRSPELNGGVERINGTWREEFYNFYEDLPENILKLSRYVKKYEKKYNTFRPHKNLDYSTPLEYINKWNRMNEKSHML